MTTGTAAGDASTESALPPGEAAGTLAILLAGPPGATLDLPRLVAAGPLTVGQSLGDARVRAALPIVTSLPRALRAGLTLVDVPEDGQLTLHFGSGLVVLWGGADRTLAKTVALKLVLDTYERAGKKCMFVDVSLPGRVLARPVLK